MRTDKDLDASELEDNVDKKEKRSKKKESREEQLEWLLDMEDYSDPEESLFRVEGEEFEDTGLSAYEAEVAGRPMFRGNEGGDDLANYVDDEIVLSSDTARSDIYGAEEAAATEEAGGAEEQVMAIDFSRRGEDQSSTASSVDEGTDILGLASDDDMGETYLTIKRVNTVAESAAAGSKVAAVAGGGTEEVPTGRDEDGGPHVETMAEAPVPTQVAEPGDQAVANETAAAGEEEDVQELAAEELEDLSLEAAEETAPEILEEAVGDELELSFDDLDLEEDVSLAVEDGASAASGEEEIASVEDYVASVPQPETDEEFDDFLLQGEHLEAADSDPDELVLHEFDGELSVDASDGAPIEVHEDFDEMEGFGRDAAGEIAAAVPAVMDEMSVAARQRLQGLGLEPEILQVDAMLGTDEESIKRCEAEGYAPVTAVSSTLPGALESLSQEARDAVYVRLFNTEAQCTWNDLFSPDFVPGTAGGGAVQEGATDEQAVVEALEEPQADVEGFGEDIFGAGFGEDFDDFGDGDAPGDDIDAAFLDLSGQSADGGDAICGVDMGEFDAAGEEEPEAALEESDEELVAANEEVAVAAEEEDATVDEVEEEVAEPVAETEQQAEAAAEPDVEETVQEQPQDSTDMSWCIPSHIKFSYTSRSGGEIFADFLDAFIEEGSAEIEKLEDQFTEWEKDIAAEEVAAEVSRTLHTVKGIAKGVGLQRFGTLIHNFETLLEALPRPEAGEEQNYFRILNVWLDAVVRGIEHVQDKREDIASELPAVAGAPVPAALEAVDAPEAPAADQEESEDSGESAAAAKADAAGDKTPDPLAAQRESKRDQQLADEGAKALAAQQSVRITADKLDHLLNLSRQTQQLSVRASQSNSRSKRSTSELQGRLSSVRTHIGKIADRALLTVNARGGKSSDLDALEMDQYSELQEAASILREGVEDLADLIEVLGRQNSQVEALLKQQSAVISSISTSIQDARVVPVSRLMPSIRRLVRTVSTDLGKVVTFKVLNEIGALDRDHFARLQVALEHMVRNALDHGIETPEERLALGKQNAGTISIDVRKSGGDYVITLADDGRGIDPDTLRESAYEKGLDIDVDALSDDEAVRLIFHKGFSTANELSEISGRGVGMDIVLTELQQIGGDIAIKSRVGKGTTFEVRIPSNVTVNGALLVNAGANAYAVPLNGLIAVEQVPADDYFAAVAEGRNLNLFDMQCEPAYLATLCQGVGLPERSFWEAFVPVIIAGSEDRYMAIALDSVQEALELVVRSLGNQFSTVPGVAGAATTADGEAIVALDLNMLVESVRADGTAAVSADQEKHSTLLALVVDDSRTQRMVATSQLDTVGVESVTAENGMVAIDLLNATHRLPDVVLLDVEMPVKDGIETLREIRKSQRYGHLPVIMVTSRTGAKHRALAKEAGCNAYMGKPFNFPALIEQINVLTGHDLQLS